MTGAVNWFRLMKALNFKQFKTLFTYFGLLLTATANVVKSRQVFTKFRYNLQPRCPGIGKKI